MNANKIVTFGGPSSQNDLEMYFRARTKDLLCDAFNEIEAGLARLQESQEKELTKVSERDDMFDEVLCETVRRQRFERQKLMQTFIVRWGTGLAIQTVVGLGRDLSDYNLHP